MIRNSFHKTRFEGIGSQLSKVRHSTQHVYGVYLHLAKRKLVGVEQYIRAVEELRGELLHVRHVVFIRTPSPALAQVVEYAVGAVETPALRIGGENAGERDIGRSLRHWSN